MTTTRKMERERKAFEQLPFHEKRRKARADNRATKRKKREWSPNRPQRPDHDDIYTQIAHEIGRLQGSAWTIADYSGLSTTTIYNMRHMKNKTSYGTTLQMAAKALGGRLVFIKDN